MRWTSVLLAVIVTVCGSEVRASDAMNRIGISVGGIQIVGFHYERVYDDYAVRAEIGVLRSALSFSVTGVRYLDDNLHRPYVGLGYLKYFDVAGSRKTTSSVSRRGWISSWTIVITCMPSLYRACRFRHSGEALPTAGPCITV